MFIPSHPFKFLNLPSQLTTIPIIAVGQYGDNNWDKRNLCLTTIIAWVTLPLGTSGVLVYCSHK